MLYLRGKDDFVDTFQSQLLKVKVESGYSIKTLQVDGGSEFISIKLKLFYKKQDIIIQYVTSYIQKENRLAEQKWRTIVNIKDAILIDNNLPNRFQVEEIKMANYLWNRLPTRTKSHSKIISEEGQTRQRQNLQYV